jgi:hypothetical protein
MFFCCTPEGFVPPREPVNGIMGMLLQVRAFLARKMVWRVLFLEAFWWHGNTPSGSIPG